MSHSQVLRPHLLVVVGLLSVLLLAACGAPPAGPAAESTAAQDSRVGMLIIGSAADGGWNSTGTEGLRQVRDTFDVEIDYKELKPFQDWNTTISPDWEAAVRAYGNAGYPLVFAHNRRFDKLVSAIAPSYPNTRFVITGGSASGANFASVTLKNDELGYTLGVLAGLMTRSNIIGTIAGEQLRPFIATTEGFKRGVSDTNPQAKIIEVVLPKPAEGQEPLWNRTDGANNVAEDLIAQGADILFGRAASANVGIIQVAEKHGVYVVNYGTDLSNLSPKTVLASGVQVVPATMTQMMELFRANQFEGKNYHMGFAESAVRISPLREDIVPPDVRKRVDQAREDLITGKIVLEIER